MGNVRRIIYCLGVYFLEYLFALCGCTGGLIYRSKVGGIIILDLLFLCKKVSEVINTLIKNRDVHENRLVKVEKRIVVLEEQFEGLEEDVVKLWEKGKNKKLKNLEVRLREAEEELLEKNKDIESLESKLNKVKKELILKNRYIAKLEARVKGMNKKFRKKWGS